MLMNWFMGHLAAVTGRVEPRVEFDDVGVTRYVASGETEHVTWDELEEVGIMTTSEGPFVEDVFWMLIGRDGNGCAVPGGLLPDGLLARLQRLPGFDNIAVCEAMGSCDDASFLCWRRSG